MPITGDCELGSLCSGNLKFQGSQIVRFGERCNNWGQVKLEVADFFGGGGGYRTPGPRLMSPLLYQLSYTATPSLLEPAFRSNMPDIQYLK